MERGDEGVDLLAGVIQRQRRARGGGNAQPVPNRPVKGLTFLC